MSKSPIELSNRLHFSSNPQNWDVIFSKYNLKKYKFISIHFKFQIPGLQDSPQSDTSICLSSVISQDSPQEPLAQAKVVPDCLTPPPHASWVLWY